MAEKQPAFRALDAIMGELWAITPEAMQQIIAIAQRTNESPELVAAQLGRPLDNTRTVDVRGTTAVIPVVGPIFRYANLFTDISGATSIEVLSTDFQQALTDPSVHNIVLNVDSPGGQASGVGEFADMVRASSKPVTAYVGNMAASAGYWIAAAAHEVVINKAAEVGSVGAVMRVMRDQSTNAIEIVSSQSPLKRAGVDTEAGRAELQARVDALAQVFVESVASFRGVDVQTALEQFGKGGIKVGANAIKAKMADRLSSFEQVIAGLSGSNQKRVSVMGVEANQNAPEITREYIAAQHPAIAEEFRKEGRESALEGADAIRAEGATAERARIQAVREQSMPGHEALIETLMFDGVTTGEQAAVKVLSAEKTARGNRLDDLRADAPEPIPNADAPGPEPTVTWQRKVEEYQASGLTKGEAFKKLASENPDLHQAMIDEANGGNKK